MTPASSAESLPETFSTFSGVSKNKRGRRKTLSFWGDHHSLSLDIPSMDLPPIPEELKMIASPIFPTNFQQTETEPASWILKKKEKRKKFLIKASLE